MTNTREDFTRVRDWVISKKLLNTGFYGKEAEQQKDKIETTEFGSLVQLAFSGGFGAMRNTCSPELDELVFWYYAGHGVGKEGALKKRNYSSTPLLTRIGLSSDYHKAANKFVEKFEGKKLKGGELCLHKVGFCGLHGLLKPWIAAIQTESINAPGKKKKNKHLVLILDSCHSGILADEL